MRAENTIPAFGLYGEQGTFPDVIHIEDFAVRAPIHDWRILPHRHSQMSQLFRVTSGWIDATTDSEKHIITAGHFLYIPEYCVHEFRFDPGTRGEVLSFPTSIVRDVSPATDQVVTALSRPVAGHVTPPLDHVIALLREVASDTGPFRAQQITGLAYSVLARLAEMALSNAASDQIAKDPRLFALDDLIAQHLSDGWTASDYARTLSLSTGHLSRLCRAATGLGAAAYIEQRRMQEACRLLAFTRLPVSEIGYRLGFQDPSYFSKRFRAARGQTPMHYRSQFTR